MFGALRTIAAAVLAAAALAGGAGALGAADAPPRTFEVAIAHGAVADALKVIKLTQGDRVVLRFTSDAPLTLHLHGYDIEKKVTPGTVAEFAFEAYAAGRYPIEVHGHGGGAHGEAALLRLEVYPR